MSKRKSTSTAQTRKTSAQAILKSLGEAVYADLDEGKFPSLTLASRSVRNIVYDKRLQQFILGPTTVKRSSGNIKHIRPFTQLLWLAYFAKKLVDEKRTSTLRDVYYSAQAFDVEFVDQAESDELITDLEVLMQMAREGMNIYPEERSAIFGNLTIEYTVPGYEGKKADLSANPDGVMIGPALTTAEFADTDAEMVLAIEKGGLFTRFVEERVHQKYKALLINTAGQPPRSTRYLLRRLNQELGLPVGILCDADPWGAHIAMVIKSGSANAAHLRELTTPEAVWLGVWASVTPDEPVIVERDGLIRNEEIAKLYSKLPEGTEQPWVRFPGKGINALSCTPEGKVSMAPLVAMTKHPYDGDVYEIRTPGGYNVKTTGNHSVEVFNPATFSFESKRTDSLNEGDLMATCFKLPNMNGLETLNLAELISKECPKQAERIFVEGPDADSFSASLRAKFTKNELRNRFCQVLKRNTPKLSYFLEERLCPTKGFLRLRFSKHRLPISIEVSPALGRLLGYHTAEGSLPKTERGRTCELTFNDEEKEYVDDAISCIREVFATEARVRYRPNLRRADIRYGASLLATIYLEALRTGEGAREKQVPFVIFNAPNEAKVEFLRGCFRGDRTINYKEGTRLSLKTTSRKLASDLTVLLRQLGSVAYIWRQGGAYVVSCADVTPIQEIVAELCKRPIQNRSEIRSMPGSLVYGLKDEMRSLVSHGNRSALDRLVLAGGAKTRVGYGRLSRAFAMFERPTKNNHLSTLMEMVRNDLVLLPVKEIRNLGKTDEPVYDLEVEGVHTFVGGAGGLVLHNSDIVKYKLPSDKLTEVDIKRLYELKADPRYTDKMWHDELDIFLKIKKKSEQEAFARYGLSYIVDKYLPEKLRLMKSA